MKTYNPKKSGNVIYVIDNDITKALNRLRHETAPLLKEFLNQILKRKDVKRKKQLLVKK